MSYTFSPSLRTASFVLVAGLLAGLLVGVLSACGSAAPDLLFQTPYVRVYPVDEPRAAPPATTNDVLKTDDLDAVSLDTVKVELREGERVMRPHRKIAYLHASVRVRKYDRDGRDAAGRADVDAALRKAGALVGADALVVTQRDMRDEPDTFRDVGDPLPTTTGDPTARKDDWRRARIASARALAMTYDVGGASSPSSSPHSSPNSSGDTLSVSSPASEAAR